MFKNDSRQCLWHITMTCFVKHVFHMSKFIELINYRHVIIKITYFQKKETTFCYNETTEIFVWWTSNSLHQQLVHTVRGTVCQSVYSKLKSSEISYWHFRGAGCPLQERSTKLHWNVATYTPFCSVIYHKTYFPTTLWKPPLLRHLLSSIGCALLYC